MRKVMELDQEYTNVVGEVSVGKKKKEFKVKPIVKKIAIGVGAATAAVLAGVAGMLIANKKSEEEAAVDSILDNVPGEDNDVDVLETDYEEVVEPEFVEKENDD